MSWHFSQALVEAYSEENCLDGGQFAPWKSIPSAPDDSCSAKMKDTFHHSPYGTMYLPSTDGPGRELLTWFREAFPVRTSAPLAKVQGSAEQNQDYGWKWPGSLAKYDPNTLSWKIRQYSLFEDSIEFSGTFPRWGMMRDGELLALTMSAHLTSVTESGLWPTPHGFSKDGKSNGPSGNELGRAVNLSMFPTPNVPSGGRVVPKDAVWRGMTTAYKNGKKIQVGLESAVRMWPTPSSNNGTGGCTGLAGGSGNRLKLYKMLGKKEGKKLGSQSLNPNWVEWLMGWPIGWTDSKPLETAKFQQWLHSHGRY